MKKPAAVILALCLCVLSLCAGCAQESGAPAAEPPAVDLDLTVLSSTVVYAQVYNLMYTCQTGSRFRDRPHRYHQRAHPYLDRLLYSPASAGAVQRRRRRRYHGRAERPGAGA